MHTAAIQTILGDQFSAEIHKPHIELSVKVDEIDVSWDKIDDISNNIAMHYCCQLQDYSIYETVSSVTNELIENAVKYSSKNNSVISIRSSCNESSVFLEISNHTYKKHIVRLVDYYSQLSSKSRDDYLVNKIKKLESGKSSIGLFTVKNYYNTELQFKLTRNIRQPKVTVIAAIPVK